MHPYPGQFDEHGNEDLSGRGVERAYSAAVRHCRRLIEFQDMPVEAAISQTITTGPVLPVHFERLATDIRAFYASQQGDAA